MATLEELVVRIKADASQLEREMKRVGMVTDRETKKMSKGFSDLGRTISAFAVIAAGRQVIQYGDAWTQVQSKLKLVAGETGDLAKTTEQLFAIAQETRSGLDATATLYQRVALAADRLGKSQEEVLMFTEQLSKQMVVAGMASSESASAILQLTQAINKGTLNGDEFRTVLETMPLLLESIEKQTGKTRGEIIQMAQDGELTADLLIDSVNAMADVTDARFAEIPLTVDASLQKLENSFQKSIGENSVIAAYIQNLAYGLEGIGQIITDLGKGFDYLTNEISGQNAYIQKAAAGGFVTAIEPPSRPKTTTPPVFTPRTRSSSRSGSSRAESAAEREVNRILRESGERIIERNRTAYEIFIEESMQANELFSDDHEQRNRELQRVWTEYAGTMETVTDDTADAFEELSVSIRDSLANAFEDAIFEADNFGDSITSILDGIARQIARAGFIDRLASGIGDFIKSQTSGFDLGSLLPSFDVGAWNLPNDMIAKVHKGEMIIPASEANAIRNGGVQAAAPRSSTTGTFKAASPGKNCLPPSPASRPAPRPRPWPLSSAADEPHRSSDGGTKCPSTCPSPPASPTRNSTWRPTHSVSSHPSPRPCSGRGSAAGGGWRPTHCRRCTALRPCRGKHSCSNARAARTPSTPSTRTRKRRSARGQVIHVVNGASQTGSTLAIDGCTADVFGWGIAGDYFNVGGELHQLTEDADTDSSGETTLTFKPALRTSPVDNAAITFTKATCEMVLIDDQQGTWKCDKNGVYEAKTFSAMEVF